MIHVLSTELLDKVDCMVTIKWSTWNNHISKPSYCRCCTHTERSTCGIPGQFETKAMVKPGK